MPHIQIEACLFKHHFYRRSHSKEAKQSMFIKQKQNISSQTFLRNPSNLKSSSQCVLQQRSEAPSGIFMHQHYSPIGQIMPWYQDFGSSLPYGQPFGISEYGLLTFWKKVFHKILVPWELCVVVQKQCKTYTVTCHPKFLDSKMSMVLLQDR